MKLLIDTDHKTLVNEDNQGSHEYALYSPEAFKLISHLWLKVGWDQKYPYTFSWMGRPVIQLPEDLIRIQEVVYRIKPDVILETGVAHGGSLIFYASLCKAMGKGRVIGVDIEIRKHNRRAIEEHELTPFIALIEGSSIDKNTVAQVKALIRPGERVLVILDSCHTKQHVLEELNAYHDLVSPGSYIVATDGSMQFLHDVPRGKRDWTWDHPSAAALEFSQSHPEFVIEQPPWPFNESELRENVTHWPGAWLCRTS
ncbi:MAG: hydroxylase [Gammaproteobacteria bacterium]|nr:MAG: hydroxylase [Gammaproteobacteria bacterium]